MIKSNKGIILIIAIFSIILFFSLILTSIPITLPKELDNGSREKQIIEYLTMQGYKFVLPKEYFSNNYTDKIAIIIHDADFSNIGFKKFIQIESQYGIKSAFYPRPDTEWFSQTIADYQWAEKHGWEIGFQYDCLSRTNNNTKLATEIFLAQLSYMRNLFNISTTDYHGDNYNLSICNLNLYNQTLWHSLGLNELYSIPIYSYYSDTNNQLYTPTLPMENLVIIQLHTDWTK